ncbi:MAG: O-antigen ligase family protein [Nitrospira sp.]|nr:O-antigen ligase family protein [Nitrospira sp.]
MTSMNDADEPRLQEHGTWIGLVLGLWLTGVFAASLFGRVEGRKGHIYEVIMLASLVWPAGYFLLSRCRFVPGGFSPGMIVGLALFGIFCGLSSFVSLAPLESTQYTALTILTVIVVLQFNTNLDAAQYERGMKAYAVLMAALVSGFALYDYVPGRRLGGGKEILNPASFALVTMSVFITAMAIRRAVIRIPILVAMGTVIYLTGARASALAAMFGLAITLFCRRRTAGASGYLLLVVCVAVGAALATYYSEAVVRGTTDFFAIQDRHRGLESGGSGRLETWKVTWNLFLSHPILGVGFRTHEAVLKVASSAHNGYLALLAEIGVIGFSAVLLVTLSGLWKTWRRNQDPSQTFSYSVLLGLACGYFVLAIFERYFINAGNPTSLLFLLGILGPALSQEELAAVEMARGYGDGETEQFVPDSLEDDALEAQPETLGVR